jgi:SAM-dependent methyltransferase
MADPAATCAELQDQTERYYERNAASYAAATSGVDMSAVYERFLKHLPSNATILDAGSGSGRDTLAFLQRGHAVEAFDSSPDLCGLSTELTGVRAEVLRFQELDTRDRYDGIWACASLLHVPDNELRDALQRLVRALKSNGAIYMSFKEGAGERIASDGRLFLDMNEDQIRNFFAALPDVALRDVWMSEGEGSHKGKAEWLNVIAVKTTGGGSECPLRRN